MRFVFVESQLVGLNPGRPETYRPLYKKIMTNWPLQLGFGENSFITKACELERDIGLKKNTVIFQTNNFAKQDAIDRGLGNPESTRVQTMMINSGMLHPCFEMGKDDHWIISEMAAGICLRNLVSAQVAGFSQLYLKSKDSPKDRQELMGKANKFFNILRECLIHAELRFNEIQKALELREANEGLLLMSQNIQKFDVSIIDSISKTEFRDHVQDHCDRNQVSFEKISTALNLDVIMEN